MRLWHLVLMADLVRKSPVTIRRLKRKPFWRNPKNAFQKEPSAQVPRRSSAPAHPPFAPGVLIGTSKSDVLAIRRATHRPGSPRLMDRFYRQSHRVSTS